MGTTSSARLRSLLVTYSFEDHDDYGLRAIVPRAVPLDPPFTPSTLEYKVQVPAEVEEIEFEAPHSPQTQVQITGNTDLCFGQNVVRLVLTNVNTGEQVSYNVKVERKRERSFLFRFARIGTITSAVVLGTVLLFRQVAQSVTPPPPEIEKGKREEPEKKNEKDGIPLWRQKIGSFLEELALPFL